MSTEVRREQAAVNGSAFRAALQSETELTASLKSRKRK